MNRNLETKRFDMLMEAIQSLKVSHEININPEARLKDGVLRWGVWVLVVLHMASLGLFTYMSFFHG